MLRVLLAFGMLLSLVDLHAQQLTVAAAADLQFALRDLSVAFKQQTGIKLRVTYGSSGNFTTQIENGAPIDVFLSADIQYPEKLIQDGFAESGSLTRYAVGRLVLWVPNSSKVDSSKGLAALSAPDTRKIALANPQHAPYGRAAVAALKSAGVYSQVNNKLVFGENISQTAQFVQSGSADAGLVALSLALSPAMKTSGRYVEIPQSAYPPIEQAAVIVKSSKQKENARRFLEFLQSNQARGIFQKFGFATP